MRLTFHRFQAYFSIRNSLRQSVFHNDSRIKCRQEENGLQARLISDFGYKVPGIRPSFVRTQSQKNLSRIFGTY